MKILGTLTVDTPNALDKVTDLNADLLDGKSSELFLSRSSTAGVYIADTAIIIDNSITPTAGGGRLKIYDRDSIDTAAKGISIGKLYSDSAADITTIDADLNISLATDKVFKLFTNATGVSSTNRLTVLANGNVGINKATPTAKLQVHVGATETTLHPLLITASTKTLFDVDFSGNIGINAAADSNVQLLLQGTRTSTHGYSIYGIKNNLTYAADAGVVASIYSMHIGTNIEASSDFNTAIALFIDSISISGGASAAKYGIYQVGAADSNVFNGITTFSNAFTVSCVSSAINIGYLQTSGVLTLGGTLQTGIITLGRSTVTHTLNIDAGATTSDNTKTINIGTGGLTGSTTAITYGSTIGTTHTFNGTVAISPGNAFAVIRRTTVNGSYGVSIQGNINDTVNDTNPGASITVCGGPVTGDAFAGKIDLTAYGNLTDSTSNIITFNRRTGVNTKAESMRITSAGNILIGKTTDDGNKLQVVGGVSVTKNTTELVYQQAGLSIDTIDLSSPILAFHRVGLSATALYETDGELYVNAWVSRPQNGKLISSGNYNSYSTFTGTISNPAVSFSGSAPANSLVVDNAGKVTVSSNLEIVQNTAGGYSNNLKLSNFATANVLNSVGMSFALNAGTTTPYDFGRITVTSNEIASPSEDATMGFDLMTAGVVNARVMTLKDGSVGIGTTTPTEKLHVVGNVLATGTVSGSNISNSYFWAFTVTGGATSITTNVISVDSYGTGFSGVIFRLRKGDEVAASNLAPNSVDLTYKNVFVYRSTTTGGTTFEQVFPDIEISSIGHCTLTFATAQTNYIFRIVFA